MQREAATSPPAAMLSTLPAATLHNFLFMLPATTTAAEQKIVTQLAHRLTTFGYVYIASAQECTMTDRDDIRFMPLHRDLLPSFGSMTSVFVVNDPEIAQAAKETYPEAQVLILDPKRIAQDLADYEPDQLMAA